MMGEIFKFGEQVQGYDIPVLNERAVRASAGILFFVAIIAFMNAWLTGSFQPTRVFVIAFLFEFTVRIFINPRYAPVMIVGQWIVRKQQPEYVGAPQKRFAWAIGFALALTMLYLVVLNNVIGPINLLVCSACLILMFFECAFGICIGCKIYNFINKEKAQLCPGGACELAPTQRPKTNWMQKLVVALFALLIFAATLWVYRPAPTRQAHDQKAPASAATITDPTEAERCKVPDYAKAMGHEEKWKLHNNCL